MPRYFQLALSFSLLLASTAVNAELACEVNFNYKKFNASSGAGIVSALNAYCAGAGNCKDFVFETYNNSNPANPLSQQFRFKPGANGAWSGIAGACSGSCPAETPFDSTLGGCVDPYNQCEQDTSGDAIVYSLEQKKCTKYWNLQGAEMCGFLGHNQAPNHQIEEVTTNDPNGLTQAVERASKCSYNVTSKDCVTKTDGTHVCKVSGVFNGGYDPAAEFDNTNSCETADCQSKPDTEPEPETPQPENTTETKPCTYVSVDGVLSCSSSKVEEQQGTKNCGTVNGSWGCQKSPPNKNGIVVDTKVKTDTNPDGSTKTTKTDTATQTKCTDIGSCKSETTTTTTVTIKDGNGTVTSVTGSCKGDNCPDENTNPDGDGDGLGDCFGDECAGGNGDGPIDAELDEVPTFGESAEAFYERIQSAPIPSAIINIRAPSGGSCPKYHIDTYIDRIDYTAHCDLIEDKRSLIRLIAKTIWALLATYVLLG